MKYFIPINQKLWQDNYPNADIIVIAIFETLKGFCLSDRTKKIIIDNEEYTWINYNKIKDELPILHFKSKNPISDRIRLLKKWGLIKIFQSKENTTYIRLNEKADDLEFVSAKDDPIILGCQGAITPEGQHKQSIKRTNKSCIPPLNTGKTEKTEHEQIKELFDLYISDFKEKISDTTPLFNWGKCEKLAKPNLKQLGLERMKALVSIYFDQDDELYRENAYSLSCFLSVKILHQLNQKLSQKNGNF